MNTGGNFANYCSMHLSNLILQLLPCISLSLSSLLSLAFSITESFSPACFLIELLVPAIMINKRLLNDGIVGFTDEGNISNRLHDQFSVSYSASGNASLEILKQ